MKRMHTRVPILLLSTAFSFTIADSPVPSHAEFRAPSQDTVAKMVGTVPYHVHVCETEEDFYGTFFINARYKQTFRSDRIAQLFFGDSLMEIPNCLCDGSKDLAMVVAGMNTMTSNRDLMAENFYLPHDFKSQIRFDPTVKIFLADFHLYVGLNRFLEGLYFRIYGPVVHCTQNLGYHETILDSGTEGYEAGYFDRVSVPRSSLLPSFSAYMNGGTPANLPDNEIVLPAQAAVPVTTDPSRLTDAINVPSLTIPATESLILHGLEFARIDPCPITKTFFADLRMELGYDWLCTEDYHIGFSALLVIPTSPKPSPEFLFEPQCSNDHHWELGGTFQGHYTLWRCEEQEKSLDITGELEVVHQFKNTVCRTFDLAGKGLSRYMLAEKFNTEVETVPLASATGGVAAGTVNGSYAGETAAVAVETNLIKGLPQYFFAREFAPVANFSTISINAGSRYIIDGTAMLTYRNQGWTFDLGYNMWVRSCEEISFKHQLCNDFPEETWALKGSGNVYGFTEDTSTNYIITAPNQATLLAAFATGDVEFLAAPGGYPIGLPDNEGHATINYGVTVGDPAVPEVTNGSYQVASTDNRTVLFATLHTKKATDTVGQATGREIETTIRPQFITMDDLDQCAAATSGFSQKVFVHLNYTCLRRENWFPYIGIGAELEFGRQAQNVSCNGAISSEECPNCALSMWGAWIKFGLSYH